MPYIIIILLLLTVFFGIGTALKVIGIGALALLALSTILNIILPGD